MVYTVHPSPGLGLYRSSFSRSGGLILAKETAGIIHLLGGLPGMGMGVMEILHGGDASTPDRLHEGGQTPLKSAVENVCPGVIALLQPPTSAIPKITAAAS